ncbi:diaminopimelate decarboxylase [Geosporobacter ferrireducens]|uniref:Diaminopimelate decarboxylase n=1 Tax=Geosporobacter ferrireducens TaxID=1424294 RepID=A0A1D8GDS6_9FIRM|nr:diaminopimelate decarboxylase [Geosporobacter ferrireducens]AOT69056.1 diaminopimelate decarboxylase [Geosporobacter ferrireducens]MTI56725.1 diaminopimelate decarboxylase [Geosporobacter ferrireducens]
MMERIVDGGRFIFDGCNTVKLAEKYGTPLYVMSENIIRSRCREVRGDFIDKYENVRAVYAGKAFLTMTMCKIIESEGLGLDVVSGGELYTAVKAGFPMENVIFHGNNKTPEELQLGVNHNVGRFVIDNLYELELLQAIAKESDKKVKVLFRVSPGVQGKTHKYISTGQKDSKFGISLDMEIITDAVKKAMDYSHIELKGFHFHLGSQLFENHIYVTGIQTIVQLMKYMQEEIGFSAEELNVGGGFGIYYTEADQPKALAFFVDTIMATAKAACSEAGLKLPQVIIEPGRWIVGEAGITLYTVGVVKEIPGIRTYVGVDGGMPDNPRPALYDAKYEAIVANKADQPLEQTVTIAGKCCESGDILIWDLQVPKIEPGDLLAVLHTGAYNYSMASNYNRIPKPAVVLVSDGKAGVIVERENYEDLLRQERIPQYLMKEEQESIEKCAITVL